MSNLDNYTPTEHTIANKLEHEIASLISGQVHTFARLHRDWPEDELVAASARHAERNERLKQMLDRADINQIKRAIIGATVIF